MTLNPVFTVAFVVLLVALVVVELIGVKRPGHGDTLTEHWRWFNAVLNERHPWAAWLFRIATAGLLVWVLLHFLVGAS
jgi:hypothetical protein